MSQNLKDLIKAIDGARETIDNVDFQYSYVEKDYEEMQEKLEDIEAVLSEDYPTEEKLEEIQKIIDR